MKQTAKIISIYSADTAGVCSALYELGGMTIVHDASGCNSTYATFDEPRWYRQDSMIYISALTETDAVMGNDEKLIADTVSAAKDLSPKFIALCGSPMPAMTGVDFDALALEIETRSGIPSIALHTNGMRSYIAGASEAFDSIVTRFCRSDLDLSSDLSCNILGATPLDFSINSSMESIRSFLKMNGFRLNACFAMGSSPEELANAACASVNLVISMSGLAAAERLNRIFGTPYVVGVPVGVRFSEYLADQMRYAAETGKILRPCAERANATAASAAIVAETVYAASIAKELELTDGIPVRLLCPLETEDALLAPGDARIPDEDDAVEQFAELETLIADPMYLPVCPNGIQFIRLPHEAFSGRCFRREIPDLISKKLDWRLKSC